MTKKKISKSSNSDVYVIIPRPHASASIVIFKDGSAEFSAFINSLIADDRGFYVTGDVIRYSRPTKPKPKAKRKQL